MSASPDGPPLAEPGGVIDTLSELTRRFEALAERLTTQAVEPLRPGLPPDPGVLEDCRAVAAAYAGATTLVAGYGLIPDRVDP